MKSETKTKIDYIIAKINTHPEYSLCANMEISSATRSEAEKHSLDIELLAEERKLSRKDRRIFLSNLDKGWKFLCEEGITNFSLSKLGFIVEPFSNPKEGFRKTQVQFGGFYPIEPEKIFHEIDNLVYFLENTDLDPVSRASNAHLDLVRIHPFLDGNGRSARLLQNICLQERKYPLAVIPSNEREKYVTIMKNVLKDRYNHDSNIFNQSESEKIFHDYIASKVLESAILLDKKLESKRMYKINLNKTDGPGITQNLAKMIRNIGRNHGDSREGIAVKVEDKNKGKKSSILHIVGDVSSDELQDVLKNYSEKKNFKYSLKNIYC